MMKQPSKPDEKFVLRTLVPPQPEMPEGKIVEGDEAFIRLLQLSLLTIDRPEFNPEVRERIFVDLDHHRRDLPRVDGLIPLERYRKIIEALRRDIVHRLAGELAFFWRRHPRAVRLAQADDNLFKIANCLIVALDRVNDELDLRTTEENGLFYPEERWPHDGLGDTVSSDFPMTTPDRDDKYKKPHGGTAG